MIITVPRNTHKVGVHGLQIIKHVFDLCCCSFLSGNSQVIPALDGILSCIHYGLGKQNHFVESNFRIAQVATLILSRRIRSQVEGPAI